MSMREIDRALHATSANSLRGIGDILGDSLGGKKLKTEYEIFAGARLRAEQANARIAAAFKAEKQVKQEQADQASRASTMFIRGLSDDKQVMPNRIAASSLFAPVARVAREVRVFHLRSTLVSRSNTRLIYTGEQLTEEDADIFCRLTALSANVLPGDSFEINRAIFLRSIKRDTGKSQYNWLHDRLRTFTESTIYYEFTAPDGSVRKFVSKDESLHLLDKYTFNESTGNYVLKIDQRWRELYENNEYSLWDFGARQNIARNNSLAKNLQRLVSTSSDFEQKNSIEFLKSRAQYKGRLRDFKVALVKAMDEMKRVGIISEWRFAANKKTGEEMAVWIRSKNGRKYEK